MTRALCLLLCVSSFAFAQTSSQTRNIRLAPSSVVQVVYVVDGTTLTTYNVDPQTFQATEVGTISVGEATYPNVITSPNGKFLYYSASENPSGDGLALYVYDTNTSGLPGSTPVQTIGASSLFEMAMHPSGKFLYTVARSSSSTGFTPYAIVRYLINQNDGRLSQNVIEARYLLESSTSFCSPSILGFNTSGTKMYGGDFCSYPHGSGAATYYERAVDLQTGALGPAQEIYSWNYYGGSGAENVQFTKDLMFDFGLTEFDGDWVSVYQVQPKVSTPLVYCTASMWAVCGNYGYPALAHPSGQYVFVYDPTNITDIGQVNLTTQQIAPVGSIPYYIQQFSPDGTVVYALNNASSVLEIEIYGFNISSGQVTQGGTISAPSNLDSWFAAERY